MMERFSSLVTKSRPWPVIGRTIFFTSDKNRPTRDEIYFIDFWRENLSMYRIKRLTSQTLLFTFTPGSKVVGISSTAAISEHLASSCCFVVIPSPKGRSARTSDFRQVTNGSRNPLKKTDFFLK